MERITDVLSAQFALEHAMKEQEVDLIQQRICIVKELLNKLRAATLLKHYGVEAKEPLSEQEEPGCSEPDEAEKKLSSADWSQRDAPTTATGIGASVSFSRLHSRVQSRAQSRVQSRAASPSRGEQVANEDQSSSRLGGNSVFRNWEDADTQSNRSKGESRFYVQKRIVVGNTSRFIREDQREANDQSTHKWMVYVRGPKEAPDIDHFISKVWFFLHPSYKPNDLVEVAQPPFHLTRRGWGEFPVRVRLFFHERNDRGHKPVDIVHPLRLDRTYTGMQTLGAETSAMLELDRQLFSSESLPKSVLSSSAFELPQMLMETCEEAQSQVDQAPAIAGAHSAAASEAVQERASALLLLEHNYARAPSDMPNVPPVSLEQIALQARLVPGMPGLVSVVLPRHQVAGLRPEDLVAQLADQLAAREQRPTVSLEQALMQGIRHFPLVSNNQDRSLYPYVASSTNQFLSWTIGKRQAAEWMRAIALKKHVVCRLSESAPKPTTKQVLMWCRSHGHSQLIAATTMLQPGVPRHSLALCGLCGRPVSSIRQSVHPQCVKQCTDGSNSLTGSQAIVQHLTIQQHAKRHRNAPVFSPQVDVMAPCPTPLRRMPTLSRKLLQAAKRRSTAVVTTHHWVLDLLAPVGLRSALAIPVASDSNPPHQVEVALATACRCMLRELLVTANELATLDSAPHGGMGSPTLTVLHIHAALARTGKFDILTQDGLAAPL